MLYGNLKSLQFQLYLAQCIRLYTKMLLSLSDKIVLLNLNYALGLLVMYVMKECNKHRKKPPFSVPGLSTHSCGLMMSDRYLLSLMHVH